MRLFHNKKSIFGSERGIALITAILACALLLALALLIINVTTKDLQVSIKATAGKHAASAAENAIHAAVHDFSPESPASFNAAGTTGSNGRWEYKVTIPASGMTSMPVIGHSGSWTIDVYDVTAKGTTSRYGGGTEAEIMAGIGVLGPGGSTDY